jgi:glutamate-ammonia-ligase adenylyltransferase
MHGRLWTKAIKESPDPQRAAHYSRLLAETSAGPELRKAAAEHCRVFCALFSGAQALSTTLVAHPDWVSSLTPENLKFPRRKQGLQNEVYAWLPGLVHAADYGAALGRLREFKERQMLRIAARDLARLATVTDITREISDVADLCLASVWKIIWRQLTQRHGHPYHLDAEGVWQPTLSAVLGLGKLGGQELNYSSDVDVILVYGDEGNLFPEGALPDQQPKRRSKTRPAEPARKAMTNHQFFNRLAERFIAEVTRMSPQGTLYRIDLRLRPEGDIGPLTRSLPSYENYYAQWGQTWERMMLIKARCVAGDESLAAEFQEMIQPFRYPRSVSEGVLREVAAMKDRIENEVVKSDELERNVKLGRGGIREVEFVAQAQQLLHAGRQPFLQGPQTLSALEKLTQYELLPLHDSRALAEAYCFLRDVEHRLQMEDNQQTHTIPSSKPDQERLARLMSFESLPAFNSVHRTHRENVRRIFDKVLKTESPAVASRPAFLPELEGAESEWRKLLAEHSFRAPEKAFKVLREFVEGPGYVHVSTRTKELALRLLPRLFTMCPKRTGTRSPSRTLQSHASGSSLGGPGEATTDAPLSDPDRVLTRLDSFIAAYGVRATLFELWDSNPAIFELLVKLFDRSEFLAELAIRTPDLVDELVTSGRLRQRKTAEETLEDLRHGLGDEDQHLWLRRYHQTELMRIGLRDILGLADFEQYLTELSALADASLQYALAAVMKKRRLKRPPFVIIGLGKLGGLEIDYGSDLDLLFVADNKVDHLPQLGRLAAEMMDLLSKRTEHGLVFHTDARLRPDGEKGLLVNSLNAYEDYYRHRAMLWEIQSLTRTRHVAGDVKLGAEFQKLAATLTDFKRPTSPLAAYSRDWKRKIHDMRMRIEKERTPSGKDELSIKTGRGGLMDAEFVAQTMCLENGWQEANTLRALERARSAGLRSNGDKLIENYRRLRRVEGILRRWSYEGETVLPDDPAPYYRVSVRCGFPSPESFRIALASWRSIIRDAYNKVFTR